MNQTIYFRKQVWQTFQEEPDKSKLVNDLLERHYAGGDMLASQVTTGAPGPIYLNKFKAVETNVEVVVPDELQPKFCKNGHPVPYPKSTCMGKGCKYS